MVSSTPAPLTTEPQPELVAEAGRKRTGSVGRAQTEKAWRYSCAIHSTQPQPREQLHSAALLEATARSPVSHRWLRLAPPARAAVACYPQSPTMSAPPSSSDATAAASAAPTSADAIDPQLYLQELSLQDCTCTAPSLLPSWKRWATKSKSGKPKTHPPQRGGHAAVWVAGTAPGGAAAATSASAAATGSAGSVILFGGSNRQAVTFADTWRFDCSQLGCVATSQQQQASSESRVTRHDRNSAVALALMPRSLFALIRSARSEWSQLTQVGPSSPPLRSGHTLVYDAPRHRVVLYGGQQLSIERGGEMQMKFCRDVWSLDCSQCTYTRTLHNQRGPPARNPAFVCFLLTWSLSLCLLCACSLVGVDEAA